MGIRDIVRAVFHVAQRKLHMLRTASAVYSSPLVLTTISADNTVALIARTRRSIVYAFRETSGQDRTSFKGAETSHQPSVQVAALSQVVPVLLY